ncbi:MAG: diguanylate cyclase [Anaerolineae bacterium]|jgi:diguanylate cyclase (GGDEF)-like protein|nr:diguanylate cyclase [Anaerolineae bacterium]
MNTMNSDIDTMTGLLTKKAFLTLLRRRFLEYRENKEEVSFITWDIDRFLYINQNYGREVGDEVIRWQAELAKRKLGKEAIISRIGGDEIAAVIPHMAREQALLQMEDIRKVFEAELAPHLEEKFSIEIPDPICITIGISAFPIDGRSPNELFRKADEALYHAKIGGRNRVKLAQDGNMVTKTSHYTQSQLERLTILSKEMDINEAELLREAMDDLLLKYQSGDFLGHP